MDRPIIELDNITKHNVEMFKKINAATFPITYANNFYENVLYAGELAKLAYYNDIPVGAIYCGVKKRYNQRLLYIITLSCLTSYRRLGIGTALIQHIINYAKDDGAFHGIYLHVQVNNNNAIEFYKKFGFIIIETVENYYCQLEPADAYVLFKPLETTPQKLYMPKKKRDLTANLDMNKLNLNA